MPDLPKPADQQFPFPLVNAHTHAAMIGFRGLAEDVPLDKWLTEYIWPAEKKNVTADFVYEKTKLAVREMKKNGLRLFSDMYFFEDQVARAAKELNIPVVIGEVILDFPTPSARTPEEALAITESQIIKYKDDSLVKVAVAPHSIYAVSENILLKAKEMADKYQTIFHIHLAETKKEFDDCLRKYKLSPVAYLEKLGILDERATLVHCVWITEEDMEIIAHHRVNVVHCPMSNLKLGSGIAPLGKILKRKINVSLGTDGAASANRLDIWEAGKMAALVQKGINHDASQIPVREIVKMMTVNGLIALGFTEWNGIKISDWKKQIENGEYNFLYHLNASEINFN